MLTSITVENFRGIERLHVEGLGRVNLIIGRNDSGKTALMEALWMSSPQEFAGNVLATCQTLRNESADIKNFNDFWLPIFRQMDAQRGFQISSTTLESGGARLLVRKAPSPLVLTEDIGVPFAPNTTWVLQFDLVHKEQASSFVRGGPQGVEFPPRAPPVTTGGFWFRPNPHITFNDIRRLSLLKQHGRDTTIIELLKNIHPQITAIELLAPDGKRIEIFIRMEGEQLIPLSMMGEGMKRFFEFAVTFAETNEPIYIDELENGLHHSVLEPLWSWIAQAARERNVQVFATTHSEECVQAASRVFKAQNDDGFRVIRLDKQEHETKAVVYDRDLVEAADRMGVEIRG